MQFRASFLLTAGLACALTAAVAGRLVASDHADTAANYNRPGADLADVYIFPSPMNNNNVVLVMDVHPLIPAGQSPAFDPNVLYQFKIDTTGDFIEDLVIQARFSGAGAGQRAVIAGPYKPYTLGTTATFARPYPTTGPINAPFSPTPGMTVFAGVRSDPFFFDLAQFFAIFPDRQTPGSGKQVDYPSIMAADTPQTGGFRGFPAGSGYNTTPASDLLAGFNVLTIVVEMPRAALINGGNGVIRLWETTSVLGGAPSFQFTQQDRLARPAVNEALATVSQSRHAMNNSVSPISDSNQIQTDIAAFMNFPAGRSQATAKTLIAVLVPDVMVADLSNMTDKASYLGYETGGATGGKFGGRALTDDIIDIDLSAIFGNTLAALGLVADDGKELPQFATDNVGPHRDYMSTFPYLGNPH